MKSAPKVILFDVLSTLVYDPIAREIPEFFGLSLEELYAMKHPTAWVDFELGKLDEERFCQIYFKDCRAFHYAELRECLFHAYDWVEGVEEIVTELHAKGIEMHALSNYPVWYQIIEKKLHLSKYLQWSFVSCNTGVRKPDLRAYTNAANALDVSPEECLFIDDRTKNCLAAEHTQMQAIKFENARSLRQSLIEKGLPLSV